MKLLSISAAIEIAVGLALMADPSLVARLLFGGELSFLGEAVGRIAGFGLFGLGLGCWPQPSRSNDSTVRGLLAYNVLAAIFFLWLGGRGELVGLLLWPAAALHTILSILLARALLVSKRI